MKTKKIVDENTLEIREIESIEEFEKIAGDTTDKLRTIFDCEADEFYKIYSEYKKAEAKFNKLFEPIKNNLITAYKDDETLPKRIIAGGVTLTYVSPSTRNTIDTKKLKEEEPELAKKYTKTTQVKATIRIEDAYDYTDNLMKKD